MTIQEFISKTFKKEHDYYFRNEIVCSDGFAMSVQGSKGHYCTPRETVDSYTALEIGYPTQTEELILEYAENKYDATDSVYPYVPVDTIQKVIEKHGGIDIDKTFGK